ncbi:MAG TPA: lycopene cyclase family protein [Flavobacterium sp.]|nr:lycopene cyclase family protein [Flavobacterium sp.]
MKHYDYIFAGAGLSALMTVNRMAVSEKFADKSILLIDESLKKTNDRTWCFWETPNGDPGDSELAQQFEDIVSQKWDSALFANNHFKRILDLQPYQYKMIRGLDFYAFIFDTLSQHSNITFINEKVIDVHDDGQLVLVRLQNHSFTCGKCFNSIFNPALTLSQNKYPVLRQHFIGWFIKSKEAVFNPDVATFMDFSIEQKGNTRFMYVLPTSETEALIEYTLFSKDLLPTSEYENGISDYIKNLGISEYEILEKEHGNIPMTSFHFWENNTKNILNIGSAGGWTKASTGYTFKNTIKKSKALIDFLLTENDLSKFHKNSKFQFYDLLLLDILAAKNQLGSSIFSALFEKGKTASILKFLDEETSLAEDLKIIWKCPKGLFISALFKRIFK